MAVILLVVIANLCLPIALRAQDSPEPPQESSEERPELRVGALDGPFRLDGILDEAVWESAEAIESLTMTEPVEGGDLVGMTRIRVLASPTALIIGVEAFDPEPDGIVAYSVIRDPHLDREDHIKFLLDPFLDDRSGYIFAINPRGARFDALVANRGEGEDGRWDAVWEAATSSDEYGWYAEIRIPVQSLNFSASLR